MATQTYDANALNVAIIAWDGMDLTDFTAPIEVLSHARNERRQRLYKVSIASDYELSGTSQGAAIQRHQSISELHAGLEEIDVLMIPGGGGFTATSIPDQAGLKTVLHAFLALEPRKEHPRALVSICAGVFFLAQAGVLDGRVATAHYGNLSDLQKLSPSTKVVRQHYVDVGLVNGLRVIVSGGITSGFDATLYLIEIQQGLPIAERSRATMDALWRREALPQGFA